MIRGFQKSSFVDFPGQPCSIIFFSNCNFRCGFCHNPELVTDDGSLPSFSSEDIIAELVSRKKFVCAACISGGEPTLDPAMITFVKQLKQEGFLVKLDTNATNPEVIKKMINAKLVDYFAVDIKGPKSDYNMIAGVKVDFDKLEQSLNLIAKSGVDYEFRTTVVPGIIKNLDKMAAWVNDIIGCKVKLWVLQEFENRKELLDPTLKETRPYPPKEMQELADNISDYCEKVKIKA
ncbi:MAG: anaerobic ribonucleoside-triphosphate reductase activating protein [Nanoarchaeota archaeon]|nr:anaerobic ribonucleoside-triphosphate reductase activating protein [Nanoarchaeota archaeon]